MNEGREGLLQLDFNFHVKDCSQQQKKKSTQKLALKPAFLDTVGLLQLNFGGFQCFVKYIFADRPFESFEIRNRLGVVNTNFIF